MKYTISYSNPLTRLVDIELIIDPTEDDVVELQLPAWRPGRYELQNYAANIKQFRVYDSKNNPISFQKKSRNQWQIKNTKNGPIKIQYQYYAYQMDAGGCWLDEHQLYLNFICCLMYLPTKIEETCTVTLAIPSGYSIACGLPCENNILTAENFYHLVDSPMIASDSLTHFSFECENIPFHIWIQGTNHIPEEKIKNDFFRYTKKQIQMMGDFPEKDYHYLFQFLPYRHYHGVEHRNSTVITLGPAEEIAEKGYSDLLGISSHELFHAWNIIKIRPTEMMPYDFTRENYFSTGFVAEGFTTYYGDLFLIRSKVFSLKEYFAELNTSFKRHFNHFGNYTLSLAESSMDLWVDGYTPGIPDRKVSIYVKGCIVALLLDLEIRAKTNHTKSLDDLMRVLWNDFGKKKIGYTYHDIIQQTEKITAESFTEFFEECIEGRTDLKERLARMLPTVGCLLKEMEADTLFERYFGFRIITKGAKFIVESIAPNSPASITLSKDDEIILIDGESFPGKFKEGMVVQSGINLTIKRWGRILEVSLGTSLNQQYYPNYIIELNPEANAEERNRLNNWLSL